MVLIKLSRAEELAIKSEKDSRRFLEDKEYAQSERTQQIADLKALRLEKEEKERNARRKIAKTIQKTKGKQ